MVQIRTKLEALLLPKLVVHFLNLPDAKVKPLLLPLGEREESDPI